MGVKYINDENQVYLGPELLQGRMKIRPANWTSSRRALLVATTSNLHHRRPRISRRLPPQLEILRHWPQRQQTQAHLPSRRDTLKPHVAPRLWSPRISRSPVSKRPEANKRWARWGSCAELRG